jgi:hypothetical protein
MSAECDGISQKWKWNMSQKYLVCDYENAGFSCFPRCLDVTFKKRTFVLQRLRNSFVAAYALLSRFYVFKTSSTQSSNNLLWKVWRRICWTLRMQFDAQTLLPMKKRHWIYRESIIRSAIKSRQLLKARLLIKIQNWITFIFYISRAFPKSSKFFLQHAERVRAPRSRACSRLCARTFTWYSLYKRTSDFGKSDIRPYVSSW